MADMESSSKTPLEGVNMEIEPNILDRVAHSKINQVFSKLGACSQSAEEKVAICIEVWTAVAEEFKEMPTIVDGFELLYRETCQLVLCEDWAQVTEIDKQSLADVLTASSQTLSQAVDKAPRLCRSLVAAVHQPWGGKDFFENRLSSKSNRELITEFFEEEPVELVLVRVESLMKAGLDDAALKLCECYIHSLNQKKMNNQLKEQQEALESETCKAEFSLLVCKVRLVHRKKRLRTIVEETSHCTCHDGVQLIQFFLGENLPESKALAELLTQMFLVRDLIYPTVFCCTKELMTLWCRIQSDHNRCIFAISSLARNLIVPYASSSAHFYLFVDILWEYFGPALFPLYLDMYIRGLTTDLNHLDVVRSSSSSFGVQTEMEIHIAGVCTKLAQLFNEDQEIIARECMLSAFSLDPTPERLLLLEGLNNHIISTRVLPHPNFKITKPSAFKSIVSPNPRYSQRDRNANNQTEVSDPLEELIVKEKLYEPPSGQNLGILMPVNSLPLPNSDSSLPTPRHEPKTVEPTLDTVTEFVRDNVSTVSVLQQNFNSSSLRHFRKSNRKDKGLLDIYSDMSEIPTFHDIIGSSGTEVFNSSYPLNVEIPNENGDLGPPVASNVSEETIYGESASISLVTPSQEIECRCGKQCSTPSDDLELTCLPPLDNFFHPVLDFKMSNISDDLHQDLVTVLECVRHTILRNFDSWTGLKAECEAYMATIADIHLIMQQKLQDNEDANNEDADNEDADTETASEDEEANVKSFSSKAQKEKQRIIRATKQAVNKLEPLTEQSGNAVRRVAELRSVRVSMEMLDMDQIDDHLKSNQKYDSSNDNTEPSTESDLSSTTEEEWTMSGEKEQNTKKKNSKERAKTTKIEPQLRDTKKRKKKKRKEKFRERRNSRGEDENKKLKKKKRKKKKEGALTEDDDQSEGHRHHSINVKNTADSI